MDGMTDNTTDRDQNKLSLSNRGKLGLRRGGDGNKVRQSFSHGRSKTVTVEVKRKRGASADGGRARDGSDRAGALSDEERAARARALKALQREGKAKPEAPAAEEPAQPVETPVAAAPEESELAALREAEAAERRRRGLPEAEEAPEREEAPEPEEAEAVTVEEAPAVEIPSDEAVAEQPADAPAPEPEAALSPEEAELRALREAEAEERRKIEEDQRRREEEAARHAEERRESQPAASQAEAAPAAEPAPAGRRPAGPRGGEAEDARPKRREAKRPPAGPKRTTGEPRRRTGRLTITQALDERVEEERQRSLASVRRARERERQRQRQGGDATSKVIREVVVPETISVQELSNRMAERSGDVVKHLMRMGVMASISQTIDADTAEIVVQEFGHRAKRVSEADVELGLEGMQDDSSTLRPRAPVVTVMGHVDHGKTSLLDALRETDVVRGEAGGITQHIGAYRVTLPSGAHISFLDTPGHEAFSAMRQRGASVTDIVILVVAADDSVQPQTVEAINHAKAAGVPMIVAINKVDRPEADPDRVKQDLLQYEVIAEDFGGDVQMIPVSALQRSGLDVLEEAILLQAELLELSANPDRAADGVVVEAKLDRGRGAVATVLVRRGTLRVGDVLVAGSEWGRVRAMRDDRGDQVDEAGPSVPVEILGLNGTPQAGDEFVVVEDEARAREISDFRSRRDREKRTSAGTTGRSSIQQMFDAIAAGEAQEVPVVIKADVQGSLEAIEAALEKLGTEEVRVRVLHGGVGGINESDVNLAAASNGFILGFNVRANPQARDLARQNGVDLRYYSIIYELIDDMRTAMSGLLAPSIRETQIGNAEIREVFSITRTGKVAGCMITDGIVRRGAGVRLLRDNVVIHEGKLSTLRRFKDEVREVRQGYECGMSFENYQDIQVGDVIECYEVEEVARTI